MHDTLKLAQGAVIGDSDASEEACALAERIGAMLAEMRIVLITGGRGGAMEAACRGAVENGGLTIGIVPSDLSTGANPFCRIVIPTGLGHARNVLTVLAADFVIAMGESAGTLSELCFAWIHGRPIFVMKGRCGSFEDEMVHGMDRRATSRPVVCESVEQLRAHLAALKPPVLHN